MPDSIRLQVELPEHVLDFQSTAEPVPQIVLDYLPKDTSFGLRLYTAPDQFQALAHVVLMGADRTSIHKPLFCLEGQGWHIDENASVQTTVHIERPVPYELPVTKYIASSVLNLNGERVPAKAVYVYWFVAPGELTASHWQRMWWMARDLFRNGVLQRWAYVSFLSICRPGEEDAVFSRMKQLIAASVPDFQLTPEPPPSQAKR